MRRHAVKKEIIMRLAYCTILAVIVLKACLLHYEARQLRRQVMQFEDERRREAAAALDPGYVGVSCDEKINLIGIYCDIAQAYSNRNVMAMRTSMLKLPQVNDHLSWQFSPEIERPFYSAFGEAFLLLKKIFDFDSPEQFAEYVNVNIEAALFFGGLYARRKAFESSSHIETLTLERLRQYEAKFKKEGKSELRDVAAQALSFWIAWIESPGGFTRQYAHRIVRANFEYARIVKPEFAMTRERAMKHAYICAKLLLSKSGYTPSWLSEFQTNEDDGVSTSSSTDN